MRRRLEADGLLMIRRDWWRALFCTHVIVWRVTLAKRARYASHVIKAHTLAKLGLHRARLVQLASRAPAKILGIAAAQMVSQRARRVQAALREVSNPRRDNPSVSRVQTGLIAA
eukprot:COSAG05_NODE_8637_length_685_cov_1.143345_1_plen_114_part_00